MKRNENETQKPKQRKQEPLKRKKQKKDHELTVITYLFTGLFTLFILTLSCVRK